MLMLLLIYSTVRFIIPYSFIYFMTGFWYTQSPLYVLGLCSPSGRTSFDEVSWSLQAAKSCYDDRIVLKFEKHLGKAAVDVSVKLQNDWKTRISRFREFMTSCDKTSVCLVHRGPNERDRYHFNIISFASLCRIWMMKSIADHICRYDICWDVKLNTCNY